MDLKGSVGYHFGILSQKEEDKGEFKSSTSNETMLKVFGWDLNYFLGRVNLIWTG